MARILTIEADDQGNLTYHLTKPAAKKLSAAVDVLEAISGAVSDISEAGEQINDAIVAVSNVLDVMTAEPDDAEPADEEDDEQADPARATGDGTAA